MTSLSSILSMSGDPIRKPSFKSDISDISDDIKLTATNTLKLSRYIMLALASSDDFLSCTYHRHLLV